MALSRSESLREEMRQDHIRLTGLANKRAEDLTATETTELRDGVTAFESKADQLAVIEGLEEQHRAGKFAIESLDRDPMADAGDVQRYSASNSPWAVSGSLSRLSPDDLTARAASAMELQSGVSDSQRQASTNVVETSEPAVQALALALSDPDYASGYSKRFNKGAEMAILTDAEKAAFAVVYETQRAFGSTTGSAGGDWAPAGLDPALTITDAAVTNPVRMGAHRYVTASETTKTVTSTAVNASWDSEGTEVSDDATTLTDKDITCYKAAAFIPYSLELEAFNHLGNLTQTIQRLIVDGMDELEAQAFVLGSGTNEPDGIITAAIADGTPVTSATTDTFAAADVYATAADLDVRFRSRGSWLASFTIINEIRQFATLDGHDLLVRLGDKTPSQLMGYPLLEASAMDSTYGSGENYVLAIADLSGYTIVDHIGLTLEKIQTVVGASAGRPTGQRGVYAYKFTGGDLTNASSVSVLNVT